MKAWRLTSDPMSRKDRLQFELIHGASATKLKFPPGKSIHRVALVGMCCLDRLKHESVAAMSGTYNNPWARPSPKSPFVDNVCIFLPKSRPLAVLK